MRDGVNVPSLEVSNRGMKAGEGAQPKRRGLHADAVLGMGRLLLFVLEGAAKHCGEE